MNTISGIASSAAYTAKRKQATGLVHGWTDVAVPRMARSDAHAESPEVWLACFAVKQTAMGALCELANRTSISQQLIKPTQIGELFPPS